jgi:hypothetical protein
MSSHVLAAGLVLVLGCRSSDRTPSAAAPPPVESPPATPAAPAPTPADAASPSATAAAATTPPPTATAPASPTDKLITRTTFGPYQADSPITLERLRSMFKVEFEPTMRWEDGAGEGSEPTVAAWATNTDDSTDVGVVGLLVVDQDGRRWVTSAPKHFHDARGIGPGASTAELVKTIPDLECENVEDEEPKFDCWSPAAPELHYFGFHGYQLKERFSKPQLAKAKLQVDFLEWRPAVRGRPGRRP